VLLLCIYIYFFYFLGCEIVHGDFVDGPFQEIIESDSEEPTLENQVTVITVFRKVILSQLDKLTSHDCLQFS